MEKRSNRPNDHRRKSIDASSYRCRKTEPRRSWFNTLGGFKLASQGAEPAHVDPAEFARIIRDDIIRYAKVIKHANMPMVG